MRLGFEWDLLALSAEMQGLPDQVDRAMAGITREAAQSFEGRMRGRFPENDETGELRRGTEGAVQAGPLGWKVVNETFYSNWYEQGFMHHTTEASADGRTARGRTRGISRRTNRGRGVMVSGQNIWIPAAIETRAEMFEELQAVVTLQRGLHLRVLERM